MDEYCTAIPIGSARSRTFFDPSNPMPPLFKVEDRIVTAIILSISPPLALIDGKIVTTETIQ